MLVKLVKGMNSDTHQCTHVEVSNHPGGIRIELAPRGPILRIPEDGEVIYVMNDSGDTVDSYRWPPRKQAGKKEAMAS